MCHNLSLPLLPEQLLQTWSSTFVQGILEANHSFITHLADTNPANVHQCSHLILCHPTAHGGLGIRHPSIAAVTVTLSSLTRSLRCTSIGISTHKDQPPLLLPPEHRQTLASWNDPASSQRLVTLCRSFAPLLPQPHAELHPNNTSMSSIANFVARVNLPSFSSSLCNRTCRISLQQQLLTAPPHIACAFPSILSPHHVAAN